MLHGGHARAWLLGALLLPTACDPAEGYLQIGADISSSPTASQLLHPVVRHQVGGDADTPVTFADGWEVWISKYLVSVAEIRVEDSRGHTGHHDRAGFVIDLTRDASDLDMVALPAQRWDAIDAEIRPPVMGETLPADGVLDTEILAMEQAGASYWVEGIAYHPQSDRSVHFAFPIDLEAGYLDCTNGLDGSAGVVVRPSGTAQLRFNFHVEHLFYANLGAEQPELRFEAIAAVADESQRVRWEALAGQRLSDLRDGEGEPLTDADGRPVIYDPAGMQLPSLDLQSFVREASRTQLHLNGHGLCTMVAL